MSKIILTRKIQLVIDSSDAEEVKACFHRLYSYHRLTCRAANLICTHMFLQENMKELLYITDDIKAKLKDREKDEDGILNTSQGNSIYRTLSSHFLGELPGSVMTRVAQMVTGKYRENSIKYWRGEVTLPNFRGDVPIPFGNEDCTFRASDNKREFCFTLFKVPFKTYLGKSSTEIRLLLNKLSTKTERLKQSAIQVKKNKIYLLLSMEAEKKAYPLDEAVIAEVSLSVYHPITVTINEKEFKIGNEEEYLHRRLAIQAAKRRLQRAAPYVDVEARLKQYGEKEKNYVQTRQHDYSRRLVDICIKNGAGTILLVNQSLKEKEAKEDKILLRNWGYLGLKSKIMYKAEIAGILVVEE